MMSPRAVPFCLVVWGAGIAGCGSRTELPAGAFSGLAGGEAGGGGSAGAAAAGATQGGAGTGGQGGAGAAGSAGTGGGTTALTAPRPLSPLSTALVTSQTPTLRWVLPKGAEGARVELFADRACTKPVQSFVATGASGRPPSALPPGVIFWRLRSVSSAGEGIDTSPVWQMRVGHRTVAVDSSWGAGLDLDGDGLDEVVVGAPFAGENYAGAALVFLGGGAPSLAVTLTDATQRFFGASMASAGDVNGDGFVDLLVGATNTGAVASPHEAASLYLGRAAGVSAKADAILSDPGDAIFGSPETIASAGDVNGDGYGDILVATSSKADKPGKAYVFLGSPQGLGASPQFTLSSPATGVQSGSLVASAGDVNGDGFADLLVAEGQYPGKIDVYLGSASGPAAQPSAVLAMPDPSGPIVGALRAADLDGDGYSDVIVDGFLTKGSPAAVYVYRGGPAGVASSPTVLPGPDVQANFGLLSLSTGDFNGDGFTDLIVGGWSNDPGISGRAFVYLGSLSGPPLSPSLTLTPTETDLSFGGSLSSAGDLDGDGFDDLLIGAIHGARVYRGSSSGPIFSGLLAKAPSNGDAWLQFAANRPSPAPSWLSRRARRRGQAG